MRFREELEQLAYEVIGAAIEVHRVLGPGFWSLFIKKHYV